MFKSNVIAIIHLIIIIFAYTSPFWLDYKIIAIGVIIYWLQVIIFKGCILTKEQFGVTKEIFVIYYIEKLLDINIPRKQAKFFMDVILPVFILLFSVFIQTMLKVVPFIEI